MDKINKLWEALKGRFKSLCEKIRVKLIKLLGGYTFPPVAPEIKAETVTTVPVTATMMVDKNRYERDRGYIEYVKEELVRLLGHQIINSGVVLNETVVELNDDEYIVKVSAKLVKEEK